jgi:hypothetical protein
VFKLRLQDPAAGIPARNLPVKAIFIGLLSMLGNVFYSANPGF